MYIWYNFELPILIDYECFHTGVSFEVLMKTYFTTELFPHGFCKVSPLKISQNIVGPIFAIPFIGCNFIENEVFGKQN